PSFSQLPLCTDIPRLPLHDALPILAAMCLIAFALGAHESFAFVVAANRDEFYARETAPAAWWDGKHEIFGGRDLRAGGTWLAIRSEEHTSELQSRENLVCRLLLEKK